jgi:cell division protein FtsL
MAYYGNLALRPERVEEQRVQPTTRNNTAKSKVTRRRSIPIGEKLLYLFAIAVVVFIAGFIIFRYAQIYQINNEIQAKNKLFQQTSEKIKEQQKEVDVLSDLTEIKRKAVALGMVPIDPKEKIKVSSKNDQTAMAGTPNKG